MVGPGSSCSERGRGLLAAQVVIIQLQDCKEVSYLAFPPLKGFAVVAPEEIIHVAPELKVCPLALADPVFWGCRVLVTNRWGMNREAEWLEKVMELRCCILGKVSGIWEEYWQHFFICFRLL